MTRMSQFGPPLTPDHSTVDGRVRMGPPDCHTFEDCDVVDGVCQYEGCRRVVCFSTEPPDPREETTAMSTRFEVSVPLVVIVKDGQVVDAKVEGWGGFFSSAEAAAGVWDPDEGNWGHADDVNIAKVAWRWTRERIQ